MALNSVLGQALSRNKAHEKVDLWKEREIQDKGSRCTISLKSRKGDVVRQVTKVPEGAEVTSNVVNQFENEREENAAKKEDELLERLANGKDPTWRPDQYLSQLKGQGKLKLKLRPQDCLRMDPAFLQKVVAEYKAQKKAAKKNKKKKKQKKEKKKAGTKEKKEKKDAKVKKEKKCRKDRNASEEENADKEVKKEHHEVTRRATLNSGEGQLGSFVALSV
ncbi:unnamed protein product [Symbiodinium pilosum]|uniref:Uncharacterized protein n=1 Tax=Symbiodinium pilosum TaxID=2952 RepID=A0A812VQH2_SYMPI|nr:unnamed protein product [Symbiodinium pilosum]